MGCGEQCVMIGSMNQMLVWHVDSWASTDHVRVIVLHSSSCYLRKMSAYLVSLILKALRNGSSVDYIMKRILSAYGTKLHIDSPEHFLTHSCNLLLLLAGTSAAFLKQFELRTCMSLLF